MTNTAPKYPHIEVQLSGSDGNAFSMISRVRRELKRDGVSQDEIDNFMNEAMSGDYNHVLQTIMKTVSAS